MIQESELKRYHIHAHELRDLLKSLCTLNGVNHMASEFFLGHTVDKLGYDKSPEYNEEWFRNEYRKVEPLLNVISNPKGSKSEGDLKNEMLLILWREQAKMFGIDPRKVRIEKQKELKREPDMDEEKEALQVEIKKLSINPQKLKEETQFENKLVAENELEDHLNKGWEMVQTVNSKILVRKKA